MSAALSGEALAACAAEPIHVPGAIQPHGALLVLRESPRLEVVQASRNLASLLGLAASSGPLAQVVGRAAADAVERELAAGEIGVDRPLLVGREQVGRLPCDLIVHRHAGKLMVELEAEPLGEANTARPIHDLVRSFIGRLREQNDSVASMCALAAREVRRMTGFAHTLVYAFDADGHGEVLAEDAAPGWPARYLGHRFPASDIPAQARELYRRNHVRLIPDADYRPVPLEPPLHPDTGAPTDLSFAALRSVSPVHLEYMRQMGTRASMSASIIVGGQLWGLVSCHHGEPRRVSYAVRAAFEHLAQILSLQIEGHEERREIDHRLELRTLLVTLLEGMGPTDGSLAHLASLQGGEPLLRFAAAGGAAIVQKGRCTTVGAVPEAPALLALVEWLAARNETVYATDALPREHAPAEAYAHCASGLLAVAVSKLHRDFVLWFRPEAAQTIRWAGNPHKPPGPDGRLHPRMSFETWSEQRRGHSLPWRASELDLAAEFRSAMLGVVLQKAEELAQLATELERSNAELEAFSYSVSHDLRAPLRHIAGYAELMEGGPRRGEASQLSERERRYVGNIKEAAAFAGSLVDGLLSFSRIGRAGIKPVPVELDAIVAAVVGAAGLSAAGAAVQWRIEPLPRVQGDPMLLRLAVENLVGNAVKYSAMRRPATIEIRAARDDAAGLHGFAVADNGIGFDMKYAHKLFNVFQRLHGMDEFEGTGIGLANVRRIAERHGGQVRVEGAVDRGATFTFLLPASVP